MVGDQASARYANEKVIALYRQAVGLTEKPGGDRQSDIGCVGAINRRECLTRVWSSAGPADSCSTDLSARH